MSDETSDRTHYSSSKTGRKRASSAASGSRASTSRGEGTSSGRGAASGSRKADDPAAWAGAPGRQSASERTRAFGKRVGW